MVIKTQSHCWKGHVTSQVSSQVSIFTMVSLKTQNIFTNNTAQSFKPTFLSFQNRQGACRGHWGKAKGVKVSSAVTRDSHQVLLIVPLRCVLVILTFHFPAPSLGQEAWAGPGLPLTCRVALGTSRPAGLCPPRRCLRQSVRVLQV